MYHMGVNVAVIGLGKLGLPLAALLANRGFSVVGYDKNEDLVASLNDKSFRSREPFLEEYLSQLDEIEFISKPSLSLDTCEIFFIIVPTPSDANGWFSNQLILDALRDLAVTFNQASKKTGRKIIIDIVSTVMPGSCSGEIMETISKYSSLNYPEDFEICYNPEFVALGSVISDMESPDMHLIGANDPKAAAKLISVLQNISKKSVPSAILSLEEAELVKIAVNNFVTMKISYANALMQVAASLKNIDVNRVATALGLDTRIGSKYLRPAMPYGGPCFPRDTRALDALFRKFGMVSELSRATEITNSNQVNFIVNSLVDSHKDLSGIIGFIGISYKKGSSVIDDSPAIKIGNELMNRGIQLAYWDDAGTKYPSETKYPVLEFSSARELCEASSIVFISRESENMAELSEILRSSDKPVIDPWGLLS